MSPGGESRGAPWDKIVLSGSAEKRVETIQAARKKKSNVPFTDAGEGD